MAEDFFDKLKDGPQNFLRAVLALMEGCSGAVQPIVKDPSPLGLFQIPGLIRVADNNAFKGFYPVAQLIRFMRALKLSGNIGILRGDQPNPMAGIFCNPYARAAGIAFNSAEALICGGPFTYRQTAARGFSRHS